MIKIIFPVELGFLQTEAVFRYTITTWATSPPSVGWIARGITIIGGATATFQIATDDLTYNYPVLRLPIFLGNDPFTIHTVAPSGLYK